MKSEEIIQFFNTLEETLTEDTNFIYSESEELFHSFHQILEKLNFLNQNQICYIFSINMDNEQEAFSIYWEYKESGIFLPDFDRDIINEVVSVCSLHKDQLIDLSNYINEEMELNGGDLELIKNIQNCKECNLKLRSKLKISKLGINKLLKEVYHLNEIIVKFWLDYINFISELQNLSFEKIISEIFPKSEICCYFFLSEIPNQGIRFIPFFNLQNVNKNKLNELVNLRENFIHITEERMKYFTIERGLNYFPPEFFLSNGFFREQFPEWLIHVPNILLYTILCTISTKITKDDEHDGHLQFFIDRLTLRVFFRDAKKLKIQLNSEKANEFLINKVDLNEMVKFYNNFLLLDWYYETKLLLIRKAVIKLLNYGEFKFYAKSSEIKKFFDLQPRIITIPQSNEDFISVVKELIDKYRHQIEEKKGYKLLWNNKKSKDEEEIQIHFFTMLKNLAETRGIIVTREPETGRGSVDFKFSNNVEFQAHLEIKKDTHPKLIKGLEKQLPTYLNADEVKIGFYIVFLFKKTNIELIKQELKKIKKNIEKSKGINLFIEYIDATKEKKSASKL